MELFPDIVPQVDTDAQILIPSALRVARQHPRQLEPLDQLFSDLEQILPL